MTAKTTLPTALQTILDAARGGRIVALTGAGISAESGIPTFRGEEGYWVVGGRNYQPEEMATQVMFGRRPRDLWSWYLFRRSICRAAKANPGHTAMVTLEKALGDRFTLVTQNVDGLHLRAGNTLERTWQIHGNIDYMRCTTPCTRTLFELPDGFEGWERGRTPTDAEWTRLVCPKCGTAARPHVLWFDEYYDEEWYRFESSIRVSQTADLLLVVGTAGATNLANQMVQVTARAGGAIVDVNPAANPFSRVAERLPNGFAAQGPSGEWLPRIARYLLAQ